VRATDVRLDDRGRPGFTLVTPEGSAAVRMRLFGEHNVTNALAAAALAGELGLGLPQVADGLSAATARSRWRMEVTQRPDGVTVINDAYNASPEAMAAAIEALAAMARGRRAFAVLGPMYELGSQARAIHEEVGRLAARAGVDGLIVVGEEAAPILAGAKAEGSWHGELLAVPDAGGAVEALAARLAPGDVVLVKAAHSFGLEGVALALTGEAAQ
jgi:UDP-N-acetylmuramoyl-tripeptide--D-alanyl-D-alanine ligase